MTHQVNEQLELFTLPELTNCDDFNAYVRFKRIPILGQIELTRRCNLNCIMCYSSPIEGLKELDYNEICSIVDDVAKEGCLWLLLTGGEPFIHKDFIKIYKYIAKKGINIYIETNATLLSSQIMEVLHDISPVMIAVSFYGATKATYESVTRVPGSFEKFMEGIKLLKKYDVPFRLRTPLTILNQNELEEMKKFADNINVSYNANAFIFPKQNGSRISCEFVTSLPLIGNYSNNDNNTSSDKKESRNFHGDLSSIIIYPSCMEGINSFYVNAYCELQACIIFWNTKYNLREGSFHDAWYNWIPNFRRLYPSTTCIASSIFRSDGLCPGGEFQKNRINDLTIPIEKHVINFVENSKNPREETLKQLGLPDKVYYEWVKQFGNYS